MACVFVAVVGTYFCEIYFPNETPFYIGFWILSIFLWFLTYYFYYIEDKGRHHRGKKRKYSHGNLRLLVETDAQTEGGSILYEEFEKRQRALRAKREARKAAKK